MLSMYQKIKLNPSKPEKVHNHWCRSLYKVEGELVGNTDYGIGIDPGVNFGITLINQGKVTVYYGSLRREVRPGEYGLVALNFLHSLPGFLTMGGTCVVEGAAFHKTFGQV